MTTGLTPDGWSVYDDTVPHTTGLPDVVERTADLRSRRDPPAGASLADVGEVVAVVSSSRGGSSLVGQVLRRVPGLLHLRAEVNPLFTLAGLHEGAERRRVLEEELLRDVGAPAGGPLGEDERARLVLDLAWRITVQWPDLARSISLADLLSIVGAAVPRGGDGYDPVGVHLRVLQDLRRAGAAVHPGYYDLPTTALETRDRRLAAPTGPPSGAVVEMAPFVAIDRWRPATREQLQAMPLVLCTPRLSFRLDLIRDLFPAAELRVVHLTRNPAASVNGLIDGWLHHGFSNCPVPGGLAIAGYSGEVPGGDEWWCFDFAPGWPDRTSSPLQDVCAFQWRAAHEAAVEATGRLGLETLRVRFEDVVGDRDRRRVAGAALAAGLGVEASEVAAVLGAELPVVMATARPAPGRWRRREADIVAALAAPEVVEVASRLGYRRDRSGWV